MRRSACRRRDRLDGLRCLQRVRERRGLGDGDHGRDHDRWHWFGRGGDLGNPERRGVRHQKTVAAQLATEAATECGDGLDVPYGFILGEDDGWVLASNWDAGPFEQAVRCALDAQDAGQPFLLFFTQSGVDTLYWSAYVESPGGQRYALVQSRVNGCLGGLSEAGCSEFRADPWALQGPPDGGPLGLACFDFDPPRFEAVCAGPCQP